MKSDTENDSIKQKIIFIDETTELEFKDDAAAKVWADFVELNSKNFYSLGVVTYARRWAKYMQYVKQNSNMSIAEIAEDTFCVADIEVITGFMYDCALNILCKCWKYGEELQKWHNDECMAMREMVLSISQC